MSDKQGEWCRIGVNGGAFEGECMWCTLGDKPLTLTKGHSYMKHVGGNLSVV